MIIKLVAGVWTALFVTWLPAQTSIAPLTVEKIMRDPKWIGSSPSGIQWSADGKNVYFKWNPDQQPADSLYYTSVNHPAPYKIPAGAQSNIIYAGQLLSDANGYAVAYCKNGDVYWKDVKTGKEVQVTATTEIESNLFFALSGKWLVYQRDKNLYAWDVKNGATIQLTDFIKGEDPEKKPGKNETEQEQWLEHDQAAWLQVVKERKEKKQLSEAFLQSTRIKNTAKPVYIADKSPGNISISADARFIIYQLRTLQTIKGTIIPEYVNESGFTHSIAGRAKVGAPFQQSNWFIYDRLRDSIIAIQTDSLPGITDIPAFLEDYPSVYKERKAKPAVRPVTISHISWYAEGHNVMLDIQAFDNKDRWLARLNPETGTLVTLDRQHDDAWVGGPGISSATTGWVNEATFWYQSETTGFSHLYTVNIYTGEKKALTEGRYEVQQCHLSADKKYFFITTNQAHPGEQQFYRLPVAGANPNRLQACPALTRWRYLPTKKRSPTYILIAISHGSYTCRIINPGLTLCR